MQDDTPQTVPWAHSLQEPWPSHVPSRPHVFGRLALQVTSTVPANSGRQIPTDPGTAQLRQGPVHATSQQTPVTQLPLTQSAFSRQLLAAGASMGIPAEPSAAMFAAASKVALASIGADCAKGDHAPHRAWAGRFVGHCREATTAKIRFALVVQTAAGSTIRAPSLAMSHPSGLRDIGTKQLPPVMQWPPLSGFTTSAKLSDCRPSPGTTREHPATVNGTAVEFAKHVCTSKQLALSFPPTPDGGW